VLTGVSCATTRYCVAVGVAYGDIAAFGVEGSLTLIDTWNGTRWTMHTAAESVGATTQLQPYAVSCPTIAFCVLDGESGSETSTSYTVQLYAASWNGRKLTTMKTVTVARSGDQALAGGVSCASSSNCALTGVDLGDLSGNAPSAAAVTEIWNGKTWQLAKVTWPKGMVDTFTLGVSCYAAHTCEVVGEDGANDAATSPFAAVAVSFKGTAGTLQAVPAPSKGHSNVLTAVSCLPWGGCVAAGETGKTSTSSAASMALMTGVLNGKAWKLDPGF
jgi:hypothetical protein